MKVILRDRHTGRTEELIRLCAEAEAHGEVSYIVCSGYGESYRIAELAKELNVNISFPITFKEFLDKEYTARHIQNFFIDNADHLLQCVTPVTVKAVTMEQID